LGGQMNYLSDAKGLWFEEIIRETEHYYQGEQQQEERASWLLGTISAFIAIIFSFSNFSTSIVGKISNSIISIILTLFLFSGICAIFALIPFKGTKMVSLDSFLDFNNKDFNGYEKFVKEKLRIDDKWSENKYLERLFFHHYVHYQRNLMKSRLINWSSFFLLFGLCLSIFSAISIIL
jgi:hypothetical protein